MGIAIMIYAKIAPQVHFDVKILHFFHITQSKFEIMLL